MERPITKITSGIVDNIVQLTGIDGRTVENVLIEKYPNGSVGAFMTKYFEMAFKGRDEATEFEKATVELFQDVFGYEAKHVGPIGLTPDAAGKNMKRQKKCVRNWSMRNYRRL